MSLPKKGSREIVIANICYRWIVSADSGFMAIVVETESGKGQRMEVSVNYLDDNHGIQGTKITPGIVEMLIRDGLRLGWSPSTRGLPPLLAAYSEGALRLRV